MCTQYADKCPPEFITNWTTPLQQQSIQDFIDAGVPQVSAAACKRILLAALRCHADGAAVQRANSGGFFHSCYLGNMVPSRYNNTGQWQLLTINNVSMAQAVTDWWASLGAPLTVTARAAPASNYSHTHFDCVWNASNPMLTTTADEARFQRFLSAMNATERGGSTGAPAVPSYVNHYFCNPSCRAFRTWY